MSSSNFLRATLAKVLNPAPGNHSGTYLTGTKCKSDYMVFLEALSDARIGTASTRNAPGIITLFARSSASAAARRNWSLLLVISIPYVISTTSDPIKLGYDVVNRVCDRVVCSLKHSQFGVMEKTIRRFDEVQKEAMGVFTLIVVEPRHRGLVKKLVEKFAGFSPSATVFHYDNVPGVVSHA
jgi:hypothetical protein